MNHIRNTLIVIILIAVGFVFLGVNDNEVSRFLNNATDIKNPAPAGGFDFNTSNEKLDKEDGIIARVIDGDTVIIINSKGDEERVRLLLIDTPESVHPDEPVQPFGVDSSDFAKKILKQGMRVKVERGDPEKDKYDRTLAYLFVDGKNFNELMLEKGYARIAYVYEPNTKYLNEFKKAEQLAKEKKLNIWSIDGYVTDDGFDMSVIN